VSNGVPTYGYTVVATLPHDPGAFTEGLFILDGTLYESTGIEGKSDFREVDLATGAVKRKRDLPAPYFGEGIIALKGLLYQLTWKQGKAFVYDLATFAPRDTLSYYGEGWGLTTDGESIVMSDGSARLRFLDPKTFAVRRTLDVRDGQSPVSQLNELEWVDGELLANVWQSEQIARIDPKTGAITQWIDLTGLISPADRTGREDVLNGIAYDAATKKLYVTGKYYSRMYEITIPSK
jgi:glutamine cyclotransferase